MNCPLDSEPLKLRLSDKLIFTCGHSFTQSEITEREEQRIANRFSSHTDNLTAYDYQKEGIDFTLNSGLNCLIADAMGLGKTIQAILAFRTAGNETLPILVLVKSATTTNWMREIHTWFGNHDLSVYVISGKAPWIPPGFDIYIMSMDSLARNVEIDPFNDNTNHFVDKSKDRSVSPLYLLRIKSVIIDECHSFKDTGSKRYQALALFVKENNIKHKVFLSGTPIKGRADEYYPTLHILRPDLFPFYERFKREWLTTNDKGQYTRIKPYRLKEFHEVTKPFVIRREKSILNLPAHTHNYSVIEIEDQRMKDSYNKQLDLFRLKCELGECREPLNMLAELAKLRRIAGMAKVPFAFDFAEEFFDSAASDAEIDPEYPQKLAIGVHHHDVVNFIKLHADIKHGEWNTLSLTGLTLDKQRVVDQFMGKNKKLLVLSTLAGGVGLNIQFCANYLILESEWSPADEDQFTSRFHRNGQTYPVMGTTLIAAGTVDDFLEEIKKEKRKVFGETIQGWSLAGDSESLKVLTERTLAGRL